MLFFKKVLFPLISSLTLYRKCMKITLKNYENIELMAKMTEANGAGKEHQPRAARARSRVSVCLCR